MSAIQEKPVRVLPADVYDTLELSALAFGGIGACALFERKDGTGWGGSMLPRDWEYLAPRCYIGHLLAAGAVPLPEPTPKGVTWAPDAAFAITMDENDFALDEVETRIPFDEWCRRLNVVRGE